MKNGVTTQILHPNHHPCPVPHLIIDGIELGEDDAVDDLRARLRGVVGEGAVKLDQLIHGLVAHQRLAHEQREVGLVHQDQLMGKVVEGRW